MYVLPVFHSNMSQWMDKGCKFGHFVSVTISFLFGS